MKFQSLGESNVGITDLSHISLFSGSQVERRRGRFYSSLLLKKKKKTHITLSIEKDSVIISSIALEATKIKLHFCRQDLGGHGTVRWYQKTM